MLCHVGNHEECQIVQQAKGQLRAHPFFPSKVLTKEDLLSGRGKRLIKTLLHTRQVKANNREKTTELRATNCVSELAEVLLWLSANVSEWSCL